MKLVSILIFSVIIFSACGKMEVYEQSKPFAQQEWKSSDATSFTFNIQDTAARYNLFMVLRHTDAYRYKNIWVDILVKAPDTTYNIKREFILSDNTRWLGAAMDDIIEHRINFNTVPVPLKKGAYVFTLKQAMREDPLQYILNAGVRVEKAK